MKLAILTFQFAHNYGAMLQAYSLKKKLIKNGYEAVIVNYYPEFFQRTYNLNPFAKNISIRERVKLILRYQTRAPQAELFENFKDNFLLLDEMFTNPIDVADELNTFDAVIFGSDQIWNTKLTNNDSLYWGEGVHIRKIAYAASLGTKQLSDVQKKFLQQYIPKFDRVSLRETGFEAEIHQLLKDKVEIVMDPVFFLDKDEWNKVAKEPLKKEQYMLLYLLQEDPVLLRHGFIYAKEHDLKIVEIHPTCLKHRKGCVLASPVGPQEFVGLVKNASCVCTNSFHAVAFSLIFEKEIIHIPNKSSPNRTVSLLKRAGFKIHSSNEVPLYHLCDMNHDDFEKNREISNTFLFSAVNNN